MPAHRSIRLFVLSLVALGGAIAEAQETNGLLVGDGRLHPYIDLEGRYDTAAYVNPANGELEPDTIFHIRPGLLFDSPGPNFSIAFNGDADGMLYLNQFSLLSHVQGEATLDLGVNREGVIGLDVSDHFLRSDQSAAVLIGVGVLSWYNDARIGVPIRPGGGALSIEPGFDFAFDTFDPFPNPTNTACPATNPACPAAFNYDNYAFTLLATWKFLPKTGFVLDADYIFRDYTLVGGSPSSVPTNGLHVMVGLAGLLTLHLSTIVKIGWGEDFGIGDAAHDTLSVPSANNLIGHFELAYIPSETIRIAAGFIRTWQPVGGIADAITFVDNRPYAELRFLLGGKLSFHAYGSVDFVTYDAVIGGPTPSRTYDIVARVDPSAEYEIANWFRISAGYVFSTLLINGSLSAGSYLRNEVYLRLHFQY
jgi:hypothetical protein